MASRVDYTYEELDKLQKHFGKGSTYDITGAEFQSDYAKQIIADRKAATAAARGEEYDAVYAPIVDEHKAGLTATLADERALAKRQAKMKLGFAQSSGPGTAGAWGAAELALERDFGLQAVRDRNAANQFATQFKLNWNLQQDQWSQDKAMLNLNFKRQQALLQQQAELNSSSWYEQLGSIIGFGVGQAVSYYKPAGGGGVTYA